MTMREMETLRRVAAADPQGRLGMARAWSTSSFFLPNAGSADSVCSPTGEKKHSFLQQPRIKFRPTGSTQ